MTPTEKIHLENIRKLWIGDGAPKRWSIDNEDYKCKIRLNDSGKSELKWFEYKLKNGWEYVPDLDIEL